MPWFIAIYTLVLAKFVYVTQYIVGKSIRMLWNGSRQDCYGRHCYQVRWLFSLPQAAQPHRCAGCSCMWKPTKWGHKCWSYSMQWEFISTQKEEDLQMIGPIFTVRFLLLETLKHVNHSEEFWCAQVVQSIKRIKRKYKPCLPLKW
jgi:hypothetical protein